MLPILPPGTLIIGFAWLRATNIERVVVIEHNGKEKIKRIQDTREGEIYVVGDHEETSTDSRHFGWIPKDTVLARVIWPRTKRLEE